MLVPLSSRRRALRNPFDFKVSLPTLLGPIFIRLIVGTERRNAARLEQEGQTSTGRISITFAVVGWLVLASSAFGFFCLAYLLKCALRINFLTGQSPLHPIYVLMFE